MNSTRCSANTLVSVTVGCRTKKPGSGVQPTACRHIVFHSGRSYTGTLLL